ncbi:SDR family NAD(P)-dependent oxidoreductase [Geothrix paludis]|uniref:SDR family NAD(P)-dependent oxidoreductase n=1 Tax=Geothrix paludis TaxID=2922722 RepID=UPI00243601B1|nr:SDR family oxidoreductase [Geothrix paludis]
MPGARTLITGSTSGIGHAIAMSLAPQRALLLHGRDPARTCALAEACPRPGHHLEWVADLRDLGGVKDGLSALLWGGERVSCLVHCAGMVQVGAVREARPAMVREQFRVNVLSAVAMLQAILQGPDPQSLESVVLVSSAASRRGEPGAALYSATKGALDGLVAALAVQLAPQVRVNGVLPGIVPTPMSKTTLEGPDFLSKAASKYPLGIGRVEDVVAAVRFLVSQEARWITGMLMSVDGGRTVV